MPCFVHESGHSMMKSIPHAPSPWASMMLSLATLAGCQNVEQGYWTKQGMSQAQFNTDYRRDFQACAREGMRQGAVADGTPDSDTIRMRHVPSKGTGSSAFTECMNAHGYTWIQMQPLAGPDSHSALTRQAEQCPKERLVVDPFGFPHCAAKEHTQEEARSIDVPQMVPSEDPGTFTRDVRPEAPRDIQPAQPVLSPQPPAPATSAPIADPPVVRRRSFDESLCIQLSQASLSNPYETFLRCMEEKGWPPSSK